MATLEDIRKNYPEYKDLTDRQLADGIYSKFYSDMPRDQFNATIGYRVNTGADVAKSAATGLTEAGTSMAGAGGDMRSMASRLAEQLIMGSGRWIAERMGIPVSEEQMAKAREAYRSAPSIPLGGPTSSEAKRTVEYYAGPLHEPETTAGEFTRTVSRHAPGLLGGPANIGRRALTQVLGPGVGEELAARAVKEVAPDFEPAARFVGSVAGGAPFALTSSNVGQAANMASKVLQSPVTQAVSSGLGAFGGHGMGPVATLVGAVTSPVVTSAAGFVAKKIGERLTEREVARIKELTSASPLGAVAARQLSDQLGGAPLSFKQIALVNSLLAADHVLPRE